MKKFLEAYRWFKHRLGVRCTIDEIRQYNIPITKIYTEINESKEISRESLNFLKKSGIIYFLLRKEKHVLLQKSFLNKNKGTKQYFNECNPIKIRELLFKYKDK